MTQTQTLTETWTESKDGTRLFYRRWPVQEPQASILIVHGYAGHSGRYGSVAEFLNGLDVDVFAIDLQNMAA